MFKDIPNVCILKNKVKGRHIFDPKRTIKDSIYTDAQLKGPLKIKRHSSTTMQIVIVTHHI